MFVNIAGNVLQIGEVPPALASRRSASGGKYTSKGAFCQCAVSGWRVFFFSKVEESARMKY